MQKQTRASYLFIRRRDRCPCPAAGPATAGAPPRAPVGSSRGPPSAGSGGGGGSAKSRYFAPVPANSSSSAAAVVAVRPLKSSGGVASTNVAAW